MLDLDRHSHVVHRYPRPLKHMRYPWETIPKEKRMTVCIAAACENGEFVVSATDGLLSDEITSGESALAKMWWHGPWLFMYAGTAGAVGLIDEEICNAVLADKDALGREKILKTARSSFRRVRSHYSSFDALSPFDMDIDDFKKNGLRMFGEAEFQKLAGEVKNRGAHFDPQLIVVGWGAAKHSCMLHEISQSGDWLHTASGFSAIGSGSFMARTMLMLMNQARHNTLAETLLNVACAKFSSERSVGVGKNTAMYVSWKDGKDEHRHAGAYVSDSDMKKLRSIYEHKVRPRITDNDLVAVTSISSRLRDGRVSQRDGFRSMKTMAKRAR